MKGFRQGGQGFATLFPLPAEGPSRHLALRLGPHEVEALRARAHVLGASLNELLMATLLHQLVQSLPSHQAELPWVTHMAVGLREAGDEALGNRVADVRLVFDAKALLLGPASALKAVVAACAPARRDRSLAIARLFERWMVSRVPLSAFRRLLTGVMRGPKNQAMSLDWSNLGDAGPVPGPFGLARGEAAYFLPPLCTPPGVGVAVATLGGHLHLVLSYAEGPVTEAQAKRWMEGVGQALRQAAQAGQDGL